MMSRAKLLSFYLFMLYAFSVDKCIAATEKFEAKASSRRRAEKRASNKKDSGVSLSNASLTDGANSTVDSNNITALDVKASRVGKVSSPFQLLNEFREEATSFELETDSGPEETVETIDESKSTKSSANTKDKRKSSRRSNQNKDKNKTINSNVANRSSYPEEVDEGRVAPLSSRLLEDSSGTKKASDANETFVANLWWVNLFTDQLRESDPQVSDGKQNRTELNETTATEEAENTPLAAEVDSRIQTENLTLSQNVTMSTGNVTAYNTSEETKSYVSTGFWRAVDGVLTFGLANSRPSLRVSRRLRGIRKATARVTGLHGVLSGKPSSARTALKSREDRYRNATELLELSEQRAMGSRRSLWPRFGRERNATSGSQSKEEEEAAEAKREALRRERLEQEDLARKNRVKEIDQLISEGQERLQQLICEKDVLQRRPNPLFNYTVETTFVDKEGNVEDEESREAVGNIQVQADREFKFPPDDLVEEYLDVLFSSHRGLTRLNHTQLWQDSETEYEEEESIGDDLLTASADARRLYRDLEEPKPDTTDRKRTKNRNGGGGSWLLRQTIGKGPSIGEKIGEVAETAAYRAVCGAVMSSLARALSSLHGINVMKHSDIRLVLEQAPDLPPVGTHVIPGSSSDYAKQAIRSVMKRKSNGKNGSGRESAFVQRDAVTETLLSHVQISAPLLKLFPIAWQRAFLGNIITLCTAIMSDFFEGFQFQILGHSLTFAFRPITEEDMIDQLGLSMASANQRRKKAEEFEAAVSATAEDVGEELKFLDRWHERALGSGVLRTQIAHLIARIVLTLTDDVLGGARMDLWSAHAGGPRLLAGLEHRTTPQEVE